MKDIDFDELDRAVSSVLGQKTPNDDDSVVKQAADDSVVEKTADDSASDEKAENQPENNADSTDESPAKPKPAAPTAPSLATKRRGKFMDVMHPSADMAPTTAAPKPPRTITPLSPIKPTEEEKPAEEPVVVAEQPAEPTAELDESHALIGAEPAPVESMLPEHVESSDSETTKTDEPAPVDAAKEQEEKSDDMAPTELENPITSLYVDPIDAASAQLASSEVPAVEEPTSLTEAAQDESSVQSTPFLTDTKVDKRPLGAFGDTESTAPEGTDEAAPETAAPADTQAAPTVPLPRELQPDVVEVESTQEADATPAASETVKPATAGDDGRVEGHPLFDTSTYHEPIAAVHGNGMPGWAKWLIGLLVCLALGAGVGYFLFAAGL